MSSRHSSEAKQKEIETRKALGPRFPRSKVRAWKPTTPSKAPRATGVPRGVLGDTRQ